MLSRFRPLSHTRENVCVCKSARGAVSCLHSTSLTRESLLPVSEILQQNQDYKCARYSCHHEDDHHVVEADDHDSEDDHHIQPVFGSTDQPCNRLFCSSMICGGIFLFLAKWQRMCGLLVQVRPGACKTL